MMNQPCPMIQDLLPLYVDQICSQESRRAVEEHVENCPLCRARLEELRREDPLPPPEQDREQSKARVLAGVKRQLRRKKLCFSARVLAGAAALGVAVWLLVFRFQTPIPYSQDIRIQEVEPAFHMKYLGRDYAGLEVLFRVTEEGGEIIRRVYLCYTGSLWTRYLSPGSPYHESVGINNGIVLDTRHGTGDPPPLRRRGGSGLVSGRGPGGAGGSGRGLLPGAGRRRGAALGEAGVTQEGRGQGRRERRASPSARVRVSWG